MKFLCTLILSAIFSVQLCNADSTAPAYRPIDQESWEETTEGVTFIEKSKEQKKKEAEIETVEDPTFNISEHIQIVLFIVAGAIILLLLYHFFLRGFFGNKKIQVTEKSEIADLDEKPMESDLDRFLREALQSGDYRMAVRIYYLMLLRALHEKGAIRWRKEKTNTDYLHELSAHPEFGRLSRCTWIYEGAWYGYMQIGRSDFEVIQPGFRDTLTKLGVRG